jgi:hypothetical protein
VSCGEHYRCDPAAAAFLWHDALRGSKVADSPFPLQESLRGCVRKACDEPDGFACRDYWDCDPENARGEASGCVPLSCKETGHCANDATSICEPSDDGPRPSVFDPHGCVGRSCAEGGPVCPTSNVGGAVSVNVGGEPRTPEMSGVCVERE